MLKIYIVIVNFNNWSDTIDCLKSVYNLKYNNFTVIVVDNHSSNSSIEMIKGWAEENDALKRLKSNESQKLHQPLFNNHTHYEYAYADKTTSKNNDGSNLILICANSNNGYAAGCNLGTKYALKKRDCDYIWVLNNDITLDPYSLNHLVKKAVYYESIKNKVGIIGNKVMLYYYPNIIQYAGGGKYNKWIGASFGRGSYNVDDGKYNDDELALDYISGASMFVNRQFIDEVGLLSEDYFLYSEEIDWAERGRRIGGWKIGYSWKAKVYHKVSACIGNKSTSKLFKKTKFADHYVIRSTILFTRKFFPYCLPTVYLTILGMAVNRFRRAQFDRVWMIIKILFHPSRNNL